MSAQDALLATKLHVPRPRLGFVVRPRLLDRLDQGLARDLILVCAPAGFGKTALLADWAGRSQGPVAWLSLDSGDNDPARFWRHAASALERVRPGIGGSEWMLESIYRLNLALADWLRGRLGEAERGFAASVAGWLAAGELGLAVGGCNFLGQVQRGRGRLDAAAGTYQQILDITGPAGSGGAAQPLTGYGHVGLAEVAYQRNELAAARAHAAEGIALSRQLSETQPLASGLATLAWIRQAEGDAAGALDAINEAERSAPGPAVASLLNPVPALRARLLLAQGDPTAAARRRWVVPA